MWEDRREKSSHLTTVVIVVQLCYYKLYRIVKCVNSVQSLWFQSTLQASLVTLQISSMLVLIVCVPHLTVLNNLLILYTYIHVVLPTWSLFMYDKLFRVSIHFKPDLFSSMFTVTNMYICQGGISSFKLFTVILSVYSMSQLSLSMYTEKG